MSFDFNRHSAHKTPDKSPGFLLWRISMEWRRAIEEALKPLDLTHPQFVILACTAWLNKDNKRTTQTEISRQAGLDPNTTSQILRTLEKKQLIERYQVDERSKSPRLTAEGRKKLALALPIVENADAAFFTSSQAKKTGMLQAFQDLL